MTAAQADSQANSSCPRCGAAFRCGMVGGDKACWCIKLPHIMPVPTTSSPSTGAPQVSCFCPACLQQITDAPQDTPSPARH